MLIVNLSLASTLALTSARISQFVSPLFNTTPKFWTKTRLTTQILLYTAYTVKLWSHCTVLGCQPETNVYRSIAVAMCRRTPTTYIKEVKVIRDQRYVNGQLQYFVLTI